MSVYAAARQWFERELEVAECRHDRAAVRLIASRIVELSEQEDFDECRRLDQPQPVIVSEEP